jgi:hypothetical protein
MDSGARGEATVAVAFLDEDGETFAFRSLRVIHEGAPEPGRTVGTVS